MEEQESYSVYERLTPAQQFILRQVEQRIGVLNRISEADLLAALGRDGGIILRERAMRRQIAGLRANGYPVLMCNQGGYYWPDTPEEVRDWIRREIVSRTKNLHRQQAAMNRNLHIHFGQIAMGEQ